MGKGLGGGFLCVQTEILDLVSSKFEPDTFWKKIVFNFNMYSFTLNKIQLLANLNKKVIGTLASIQYASAVKPTGGVGGEKIIPKTSEMYTSLKKRSLKALR